MEKYFEIAYGCFWKVISANTKRLCSASRVFVSGLGARSLESWRAVAQRRLSVWHRAGCLPQVTRQTRTESPGTGVRLSLMAQMRTRRFSGIEASCSRSHTSSLRARRRPGSRGNRGPASPRGDACGICLAAHGGHTGNSATALGRGVHGWTPRWRALTITVPWPASR